MGLYVGMDRFDVRRKIEGDLAAAGLLEKTEDYTCLLYTSMEIPADMPHYIRG